MACVDRRVGNLGSGSDSNFSSASDGGESPAVDPLYLPNGERGFYDAEEEENRRKTSAEEAKFLAEQALDFFNSRAKKRKRCSADEDKYEDSTAKNDVAYKLVRPMLCGTLCSYPMGYHVNFTARPEGAPDDSPAQLFFAELGQEIPEEVFVTYCDILPQPDDTAESNGYGKVVYGCWVCRPNSKYRIYHPADGGFQYGKCKPEFYGMGAPMWCADEEKEDEEC